MIHSNIYQYILRAWLLLFLNCTVHSTGFSNTPGLVRAQFDQLEDQYNEKIFSDSVYMKKIDSLTYGFVSQGIILKTDELLQHLSLFHHLAWQGKKNSEKKVLYYKILKRNANLAGRGGEAVFFAEKMDAEIRKAGKAPSILETYERCYFHIVNENYTKAVDVYETDIQLIQRYPDLYLKDSITAGAVNDLLGLNALIIAAHIKLKDTLKVQRGIDISEKIRASILRKKNASPYDVASSEILIKMLYKDQAYFLKDFKRSEKEALEIMKISNENKKALGDFYEFVKVNILESLIDVYLTIEDYPKAEYYIQEYESAPEQLIDQSYLVEHFKSDLYAGQEKYKEAYELLSNALTNKDKVYSTLANEMDELLYAHTESEFNRLALEKVEKDKRNRLIIIFIISGIAFIAITAIIIMMRRKELKAKNRIQKLNNVINIQISAMEEVKLQAMIEEQQRLGKELHDGLSASIASIKHQIELAGSHTEDIENQKELQRINTLLNEAYLKVRSKSHNWYQNTDKSLEESFEKRIKNLIDSALPNNHYNKNIEIDDGALSNTNLETRIELLRIVQESIVNIMKHANAKTISMLIYQEQDSLILSIRDDGKGFDTSIIHSKNSLGLHSIKNRVDKLSGTLQLLSDRNGTEIIVSIPFSY